MYKTLQSEHSQARNVLREYWVAKKHFSILQEQMNIPCQPRPKLCLSMGVMHNFIRTYDPDEKVMEPVSQKLWTTSPGQIQGGVMVNWKN